MDKYIPLLLIWVSVPTSIIIFLWFAGFKKYLVYYGKMLRKIDSKPIFFATLFFICLTLIIFNIIWQYYAVELGSYFLNINRGLENWLHTTRGTVDMINNHYQTIFDIPMAVTNLILRPSVAFFGLYVMYYMIEYVLAKISYSNPSLLQRKSLTHWFFSAVFIHILINIIIQAQVEIAVQNSIVLFAESIAYVFAAVLILCYTRKDEIFDLLNRKGISVNKYEQFSFTRLWVLYLGSLVFYNLLLLPKNTSLPFLPSKVVAFTLFFVFLLGIWHLVRHYVFRNYLRYLVDSIASDEEGIAITTKFQNMSLKKSLLYAILVGLLFLIAVNPNWHIALWMAALFFLFICLIWIGLLITAAIESTFVGRHSREMAKLPFLYLRRKMKAINFSILIGITPALLIFLSAFTIYTFVPLESSFYDGMVSKAIIDQDDNLIALETRSNTPAIEHSGTDFLRRVIVAREDQNFFRRNERWFSYDQMSGLNLAFLGGSNLCSQIVKNLSFPECDFPTSLLRKIVELSPSYTLNQKYDTDELLTIYTTIAGFAGGKGDRGVYFASQRVFGEPISHLNELEQFFLVRTLPNPYGFSVDGKFIPTSEFSKNPIELKKMLIRLASIYTEKGFITDREMRKMQRQQLNFSNQKTKPFPEIMSIGTAEMIKDKFRNDTLLAKTERTTLSLEGIKAAKVSDSLFRNRFRSNLKKGKYELLNLSVAIDLSNGKLISHWGGDEVVTDFTSDKFTFESSSLMKIIFAAVALDFGLDSNKPLYNGKIAGRFHPKNINGYTNTYIPISKAFWDSDNIPFANAQINYPTVLAATDNVLEKVGADSGPHDINLILGYNKISLMQMSTLLTAIFNSGKGIKPHFLENENVEEIDLFKIQHSEQVKEWLAGTINYGTTKHLKQLLPEGIYYSKTGTSNNSDRGWCMIATDSIMVISLVTYFDPKADSDKIFHNTPVIPNKTGGHSAGYMSAYLMNELLKIKG